MIRTQVSFCSSVYPTMLRTSLCCLRKPVGMFFLVSVISCFSCVQLFAAPWTVVRQAPLPMGFSRQKYWCGLPFPSPRDLNDPGIKHTFLYWQVDYLPLSHLGSPYIYLSPRNCCPDLICKYIENRLMKTFRNL